MEIESIQIRRKKGSDVLFRELELKRQELFLAKTAHINDEKERQIEIIKLAGKHTFSPSGFSRKILERFIDEVKVEDFI